jgi:hypothetical protein
MGAVGKKNPHGGLRGITASGAIGGINRGLIATFKLYMIVPKTLSYFVFRKSTILKNGK